MVSVSRASGGERIARRVHGGARVPGRERERYDRDQWRRRGDVDAPQAAEYRAQQAAQEQKRRDIEGVLFAKRQRNELIAIIRPQPYESQKRLQQYNDAIAELAAERDSYSLLGDHKPVEPYVLDPKRALADAQFLDAFAQSKDRLIAGPWAKSIEKYTSGYKGNRDPFRRLAAQTPFDRYSERGQLEQQFGRVNESPEEYEKNAAFWRAEVARVKAQANDATTPKEDVLRFLVR